MAPLKDVEAFQKHLRSVVKGHGKPFFVVLMGLYNPVILV